MKLSHLIYRGRTLDEAVQQFRDLGFHVEYGSKHNPQNALSFTFHTGLTSSSWRMPHSRLLLSLPSDLSQKEKS